jgi:hypothetical protein
MAVLSSDDNVTKLSLRAPCLIGPPPLMPGAGAVSISIFSDWNVGSCDSSPAPCNVSTKGADLWIYAPMLGVSVTPSKVREGAHYSVRFENKSLNVSTEDFKKAVLLDLPSAL